jgi:hypothetical protein
MSEVDLFTHDGLFVSTVPILPFIVLPEILIWGSRFFILRADGKYREASLAHMVIDPNYSRPS